MKAKEFFSQEGFRRFSASLNPNAPDPTGLRKVIESDCYPDIFDALRLLPIQIQKRLAVQAIEGYGAFPHGEELARQLVRINNIHWLKPLEEIDISFLKDQVALVQKRFGIEDKPTKVVEDWDDALAIAETADTLEYEEAAVEAMRLARKWFYRTTDRLNIQGIVEGAAMGTVTDLDFDTLVDSDIERDALGSTLWIIGQDFLTPRKNPFEPLINIYEKGCWPIGQAEENFVVFVPPILEPQEATQV